MTAYLMPIGLNSMLGFFASASPRLPSPVFSRATLSGVPLDAFDE